MKKICTNGFDDFVFLRTSKYLKLPRSKLGNVSVHEKYASNSYDLPSVFASGSVGSVDGTNGSVGRAGNNAGAIAKEIAQKNISTIKTQELLTYAQELKTETLIPTLNTIDDYNLLLANLITEYPFDAYKKQNILLHPPKFPVYLNKLNNSKLEPNTTTIELCIRYSFSIQDIEHAALNIQLLEKIEPNAITKCKEYYIHLFDGYCMKGDVENALLLLKRLANEDIQPHLDSLVRLIVLIFTNSKDHRDIHVLIKQLGVTKEIQIRLNQVMKQKLLVGDVKVALRMYLWMHHNRMESSRVVYEVLSQRVTCSVPEPFNKDLYSFLVVTIIIVYG
jgi:hypothetical protein